MGAMPSLAKALSAMGDEELTAVVQEAYQLDPNRMEKILAVAKLRYLQSAATGNISINSGGSGCGSSNSSISSAATPSMLTAAGVASTFVDLAMLSPAPLPAPAVPLAATNDSTMADTSMPLAPPPPAPVTGASMIAASSEASRATTRNTADRMAALWTFSGHTLRELRGGDTSKKRSAPGSSATVSTTTTTTATATAAVTAAGSVSPSTASSDDTSTSTRVDAGVDVDVDDDGFPILFGSCGREKKYARCSVCYFRGVRCNTAHYCACCQRPVCIRPRTHPGEEHPKICWNVLHVDKDMIQRVDKRRARRLHSTTPTSTLTSTATMATTEMATVDKALNSDGDETPFNPTLVPGTESCTQAVEIEGAATEAVEAQEAPKEQDDEDDDVARSTKIRKTTGTSSTTTDNESRADTASIGFPTTTPTSISAPVDAARPQLSSSMDSPIAPGGDSALPTTAASESVVFPSQTEPSPLSDSTSTSSPSAIEL